LELLEFPMRRLWHDIATLDVSWCYFNTSHEQRTIQSKNVMVTIMWNPTGFFRIAALRKGGKFSADYCMSEILAHSPNDALTKWGLRIEN
jgi:hypothetical protein